MPWFICDSCGDSIKKPSLQKHMTACRGSHSFTCIDCSATFDRFSVHGHNQCVTEHQKYALGATKPGGFAAGGFENVSQPTSKEASEPSGLEFLSIRPPWKCSACNIGCTSQETLMAHASGIKHKRRVRAALGLSGPANKVGGGAEPKAPPPRASKPPPSPSTSSSSLSSSDDDDEVPAVVSKLPLISDDLIKGLGKKIPKKLKLKGKVTFKLLAKMAAKIDPTFKESSLDALVKALQEKKVAAVKKNKLLPI